MQNTNPAAAGTGPSDRHLVDAGSKYALWLRLAVVALCGAIGVLAGGPSAAVPTAGLVLAACVSCGLQVYWRARGQWAYWFALADGLIVVAIGLSQLPLGPQSVTGWVFAVASITSVTCHYEWMRAPVAGWLLAAASVTAFAVGNLLAGPDQFLAGLCVRLMVQSALSWASVVALRRATLSMDRVIERGSRRRLAASVATARRAAERECLAMLHDTASATLLMVSSGAIEDYSWLPDRARRDLEALGAVSGTVARTVELSTLFEALGTFPGLRLAVDVGRPLTMPAGPAFAIFFGVQEALNNVVAHAGDPRPTLHARQDGDRLLVRLCDRGRGFRPADVSAHRRGISRSILGRMAAVGGRAEVESVPGAGTTVRWTWPHD